MFFSSVESSIELFLPAIPDNTSQLQLTVFVRDQIDQRSIDLFIQSIQQSPLSVTSSSNPFLQALLSGNQNQISPVIVTISQHFQQIDE